MHRTYLKENGHKIPMAENKAKGKETKQWKRFVRQICSIAHTKLLLWNGH